MANKIGTVSVLWRTLDIYGFTGEILDTQRTSETTVTGNTANNQITTRTDHYVHLFLRGPDGREDDLEFESRVGFRTGQTATFVWASAAGPEKGEYVAVYNNTSGQINTIRRGNNRMACIPFYTAIAILAIIIGVIGIASGGFFGTLLGLICIGYIVFMILCQKRLMKGVAEVMRSYKPE